MYDPPFKPVTWLLWFGPALVFIIALIYLVNFLRRQGEKQVANELTAEEIERLKNIQSESEIENNSTGKS